MILPRSPEPVARVVIVVRNPAAAVPASPMVCDMTVSNAIVSSKLTFIP